VKPSNKWAGGRGRLQAGRPCDLGWSCIHCLCILEGWLWRLKVTDLDGTHGRLDTRISAPRSLRGVRVRSALQRCRQHQRIGGMGVNGSITGPFPDRREAEEGWVRKCFGFTTRAGRESTTRLRMPAEVSRLEWQGGRSDQGSGVNLRNTACCWTTGDCAYSDLQGPQWEDAERSYTDCFLWRRIARSVSIVCWSNWRRGLVLIVWKLVQCYNQAQLSSQAPLCLFKPHSQVQFSRVP